MCRMFSISKWPFNIYHFSVSCQGRRCSWLYALGLCVRACVCVCGQSTSLCNTCWGKEVVMCGLSLMMGPFGWKRMALGWSENVSTVNHSLISAWRITKCMTDFTERLPITPLHEDTVILCSSLPFPPQGQTHIYPLSVVSGRRVFHAHFVLTQSIPNPISNSSSKILPSIKCTHVGPRCLTVVSQTAFACWCGMKSLCSIQDKDL